MVKKHNICSIWIDYERKYTETYIFGQITLHKSLPHLCIVSCAKSPIDFQNANLFSVNIKNQFSVQVHSRIMDIIYFGRDMKTKSHDISQSAILMNQKLIARPRFDHSCFS